MKWNEMEWNERKVARWQDSKVGRLEEGNRKRERFKRFAYDSNNDHHNYDIDSDGGKYENQMEWKNIE